MSQSQHTYYVIILGEGVGWGGWGGGGQGDDYLDYAGGPKLGKS